MKSSITSEFIRHIPKTDLHVHLDGSLRLGTLIDLARKDGVKLPSFDEAGLRETVFKPQYGSLVEYLQGFAYTCAVLQNAENIERVAFELAEDNLAEGVRYVEVRFAPQLHIHEKLSLRDAVSAVAKGFDRAKARHNLTPAVAAGEDLPFEFGIIACAMRSFDEQMSAYFSGLIRVLPRAPQRDVFAIASMEMARSAVALRDEDGLPVVGFDLAGEEAGFPAAYHTRAYQYAHSHFMHKTVHAGEAYGPESIFQAITQCHAERIGHGTFIFAEEMIGSGAITDRTAYVEQLAEYIACRRIAVEVCLTSNLQTTPSLPGLGTHPVGRMLEAGFRVSICTDNRLVSDTTVTRELERLVTSHPVTRAHFRDIILAGFKGSFFPAPYNRKRAYIRQVMDRYAQLESLWLQPEGGE